MSFLTIPSQESLFTTVRGGKPADESERFRTVDADEDDEDDEDDMDVRLIPRCSPIPRKRGSSIADETAEYMRIQLALSGGKRVSFADTTGGDLVDVKEFIAFDSDDEDSAKWEEEEAKYRHVQQAPDYHVYPEFTVPSDNALLQAVRTNKVEVENISPVENEPLAFCGVIRVLNISFNKAVYIRCTMDNWTSYYDHPADYVQGSHDGDTDKFCFKLCFAAPYTTHGSRIEFVVRYETSEGDYWANNSKKNYVVTLLLTYEDKSSEIHTNTRDVRSILKPPKMYRTQLDLEPEDDQNKIEGEQEDSTKSELVRPAAICPVVFQPELDVEIAAHPSPTVPPNGKLLTVDGAESTHCETAQSCCTSSSIPLQTCLLSVLQASEVLPPTNYCEHQEISPPASYPPVSQESMKSPLWSQAEEVGAAGPCTLLTWDSPAPALSAALTSGLCGTGLSEEGLECSGRLSPGFEAQSQTSGAQSETVALLRQQDSDCVDITELCLSSETHMATACRTGPDLFSDNLLAPDVHRSLRPSIIFLSAFVSVSVVLQEPSALFVIGLFLILHLV